MRRPDMAVRALTAGEADAKDPARRLVNWNEYEGPFFTIRMGGGVLYETTDPLEIARLMEAVLDDPAVEDAVVQSQDAALARLQARARMHLPPLSGGRLHPPARASRSSNPLVAGHGRRAAAEYRFPPCRTSGGSSRWTTG